MSEDGYRKYQKFFDAPPLRIIEWHDTETDAVGWLVINSLKGGAAGGGTRMRKGELVNDQNSLEDDYKKFKKECVFLAKTMEIKFRVSGPPIGGAKSVIRFDPEDKKNKEGVLRRWFEYITPQLQQYYGTGGDLNVDEQTEVIPIVEKIGINHPQNGVVVGHFKRQGEDCQKILDQLKSGGDLPVSSDGLPKGFTVANMITGYGLTMAVERFYRARNDSLAVKRIIIEGFGEVGGASAFYLTRAGAKVVGIVTKPRGDLFRWAVNDAGLDIGRLLDNSEDKRDLPSRDKDCREGPDASGFWATRADIFVPAAQSHLTTRKKLERLRHASVKVIACGANNPFERGLATQQQADRDFSIIPDFIANCGTARLFAYLMEEERTTLSYSLMCEDVEQTVRRAMDELLDGFDDSTGLLKHAYSIFIE